MNAVNAGVSVSVADLAKRTQADLQGDGSVVIRGLGGVEDAGDGDITFISDARYAAAWPRSKASAAFLKRGLNLPSDQRPLLIVNDVDQAMIAALECFQPQADVPEVGVHASASVDPSATAGRGVRIGPHVSVGAHATLGDGVVLHAGVRLYRQVRIGEGSVIHANCVVRERCVIGRGVILHQNVSIGADGFGYRPAPDGRGLVKMPHIGNVVIEDGVEIGANSCVDRAKFGSTVIGAGTKIDNLCQVAHNCRIGRCCLIAGATGIAGSTVLGDGVIVGGGAGIIEHLTIGNGARVGAMTLVTRDVAPGATVLGIPADLGTATLRQWSALRRLPSLLRDRKHETPGTAAAIK